MEIRARAYACTTRAVRIQDAPRRRMVFLQGSCLSGHGLTLCNAKLLFIRPILKTARVAQSVERKALNFVVVGSSPTSGEHASLASAGCRPTLLPVFNLRSIISLVYIDMHNAFLAAIFLLIWW